MNDQPPRAARRRLIDELEALSESLQGEISFTSLPPVSAPPSSFAKPLLDLSAIFDGDLLNEEEIEAPLLFWPMQDLPAAPAAAPAADRITLIEQIVTRLLPDLEQQLRDRLRGLDVESLRRLLR